MNQYQDFMPCTIKSVMFITPFNFGAYEIDWCMYEWD